MRPQLLVPFLALLLYNVCGARIRAAVYLEGEELAGVEDEDASLIARGEETVAKLQAPKAKEKGRAKQKAKEKSKAKAKAKDKGHAKPKAKEKSKAKPKAKDKAHSKAKGNASHKSHANPKATYKSKAKAKEKAHAKSHDKSHDKIKDKSKDKPKENAKAKPKANTKAKESAKAKPKAHENAKAKDKVTENSKAENAKAKPKAKYKDKGKPKAEANKKARSRRRRAARKRKGAAADGKLGVAAPAPSGGIGEIGVQFIEADISISTLKELRSQGACVVVSANTQLLTPGATGIAGKVEAVGGKDLMQASDREKKAWGGQVPVGKAAWTSAGGFRGVAFAVTLSYKNGKRVPATPDTVRKSFAAALQIAYKHNCKLIATTILSAREGYSSVPPKEAKTTNAKAMLSGIADAKKAGVSIETLRIYHG